MYRIIVGCLKNKIKLRDQHDSRLELVNLMSMLNFLLDKALKQLKNQFTAGNLRILWIFLIFLNIDFLKKAQILKKNKVLKLEPIQQLNYTLSKALYRSTLQFLSDSKQILIQLKIQIGNQIWQNLIRRIFNLA
ncbi:hypothetical protein pb186bvf_014162 [Paramecium bursaria]